MLRRVARFIAGTTFAWLTIHPAAAGDWPRFRGPNGSGVSETAIPAAWTADDVRWKIELPGIGHGSPVVTGSRIFVQAEENEGRQRLVVCLDAATGSTLWSRPFDAETHRKHRKNSFASSTPAVDAEHVYAAWGVPGRLSLVALDHAGDAVWQQNLGDFKGGHGFAASPIVYEDLVILGNDQDGPSSLIAVDRRTGERRWTIPRNSTRTTYSTPCVFAPPGRDPVLIFTNWTHGVTAVEPQSGRVAWEAAVFDPNSKERAIGSPVVAGDLVIGACGFVNNPKHVVAVRPGAGRGGETEPRGDVAVEEIYRIERAVPHIPTPLVYQGRLYLWSDQGIVTCCDAATGRKVWQHRVGGNYFGSPVCAAGHIYCVSDQGVVVVLAADDEYRELARNVLGEPCHSTPAIAAGALFIRTETQLMAIAGERRP